MSSFASDSFYLRYGKNALDRVCSLFGIIILLPLFFVIAAAIKLDTPGGIFYTQTRVGRGNSLFKLYKFRSMEIDAEQKGPQVTKGGDPRITKAGKILRNYKLDELPQLVNVLIGDISFVGPRPEVKKYVDLFWEDYKKILAVKPGITDYAALKFRNEEEILAKFSDLEKGYVEEVLPQKILLYHKYISQLSFVEDIRIIFLTIWRIVR